MISAALAVSQVHTVAACADNDPIAPLHTRAHFLEMTSP